MKNLEKINDLVSKKNLINDLKKIEKKFKISISSVTYYLSSFVISFFLVSWISLIFNNDIPTFIYGLAALLLLAFQLSSSLLQNSLMFNKSLLNYHPNTIDSIFIKKIDFDSFVSTLEKDEKIKEQVKNTGKVEFLQEHLLFELIRNEIENENGTHLININLKETINYIDDSEIRKLLLHFLETKTNAPDEEYSFALFQEEIRNTPIDLLKKESKNLKRKIRIKLNKEESTQLNTMIYNKINSSQITFYSIAELINTCSIKQLNKDLESLEDKIESNFNDDQVSILYDLINKRLKLTDEDLKYNSIKINKKKKPKTIIVKNI